MYLDMEECIVQCEQQNPLFHDFRETHEGLCNRVGDG